MKGLNKQRGNMYPWITHTWNPIKGDCPHKCSYCYAKLRRKPGPPQLRRDLIKGTNRPHKRVFVGSAIDMFADDIPKEWIDAVLEHCKQIPGIEYLFQTKNPKRFLYFPFGFPEDSILGTTIETSGNPFILGVKTAAPSPKERYQAIKEVRRRGKRVMVSIEPILSFKHQILVNWIDDISPEFVSIGADSKQHRLQEPTAKEVNALIQALIMRGIDVKTKPNLKRLL